MTYTPESPDGERRIKKAQHALGIFLAIPLGTGLGARTADVVGGVTWPYFVFAGFGLASFVLTPMVIARIEGVPQRIVWTRAVAGCRGDLQRWWTRARRFFRLGRG